MKLPSITTLLTAASTLQTATAAAIPPGKRFDANPGGLSNSTLPTNSILQSPPPRTSLPPCSPNANIKDMVKGGAAGGVLGAFTGAGLGFVGNLVAGLDPSAVTMPLIGAVIGSGGGGAGGVLYTKSHPEACAAPDAGPIDAPGNATSTPQPGVPSSAPIR